MWFNLTLVHCQWEQRMVKPLWKTSIFKKIETYMQHVIRPFHSQVFTPKKLKCLSSQRLTYECSQQLYLLQWSKSRNDLNGHQLVNVETKGSTYTRWNSTQQQKRMTCGYTQQHSESQKHYSEWDKPEPKENKLYDPVYTTCKLFYSDRQQIDRYLTPRQREGRTIKGNMYLLGLWNFFLCFACHGGFTCVEGCHSSSNFPL